MEEKDLREAKPIKESKSSGSKIRYILIFIIFVVLLGGIYLLYNTFMVNEEELDLSSTPPEEVNTQPLLDGPNAIYVSDQPIDDDVNVSLIVLEEPGYVVIHRDNNGAPGEVMASSEILDAGPTNNLTIDLPEETADGEVYFAMLHTDNGDGEFNFPGPDVPVEDPEGNVIMMKFNVTEDIQEALEDIAI